MEQTTNTKKEYRPERFQFILSVNDNIICQRYFKINGFNPISLNSLELKETIDSIVNGVMTGHPGFDSGILNGDLKSKSRTYMWYTYNENYPDDEYTQPLDEAWSTTFKFAFLVDEKEVISKVWDGSVYPKFVRESVDIVNKKSRFDGFDGRMNFEMNLARKMVIDKPDLSYIIINLLCDVCSMTYSNQYDYTLDEDFGSKRYCLINKITNDKMMKNIEKQLAEKTKSYFDNLYS